MNTILFTKTLESIIPSRAFNNDAGYDIYTPSSFKSVRLELGDQILIDSGIHVHIPKGSYLKVENRSSMCVKKGIIVGACIIDCGYEGSIKINLMKVAKGEEDIKNQFGEYWTNIYPNEKIAQLILNQLYYKDNIEDYVWKEISKNEYTQRSFSNDGRGINGFGSTDNQTKKDDKSVLFDDSFDSFHKAYEKLTNDNKGDNI
jgi:deoxyuridine 5'-triphosphate nucleotidohydrolase